MIYDIIVTLCLSVSLCLPVSLSLSLYFYLYFLLRLIIIVIVLFFSRFFLLPFYLYLLIHPSRSLSFHKLLSNSFSLVQ